MPPSRSKPKNAERQRAERRGHLGEFLAALYLRAKFYRIVARRFKTPVGEIDLVARRGGTLVFVEVKLRRSRTAELATLEGVNQQRILRAANYYLARHPEHAAADLRCDVIFLAPRAWPHHIVNAFGA